jgi:hypothetical protein
MAELTLPLQQGITLEMTFAWRQPDGTTYANWNDWNVYSQVRNRKAVDADLLLDLSSHFTVVDETAGDGKILALKIPGEATAAMEAGGWANARWNIIAVLKADHTVDAGIVEGPVTFDASPTDVSGAEA